MKTRHLRVLFILGLGLTLALLWIVKSSGMGLPISRAAGPWYVAPDGDDGDDCTSPSTPCATINGTIAKASSGDTIYVAIGTYTGDGDEVVLLDKDITLSGGWEFDVTLGVQSDTSTIDGEGERRGITVMNGVTATVERFTVQNGLASYEGGGVNNSGTLTLNNSTVSGNTATGYPGGGGISNTGALTLIDSTISGNTATAAGGIFSGLEYNYDIVLTLNNSTVSGNTASDYGGGIVVYGGSTAILNDSIVSDNTAIHSAGGIRNGGNMILNSSTVSGNTVTDEEYHDGTGGGIWNGGDLAINDSTISGNMGRSSGGGLYNWQGEPTLNSSTVSGNKANDSGGGIYAWGGTVILKNSVLAGNDNDNSPDCSGSVDTLGYNLVGDTSGCTFAPGTGDLTDANANLGQLIGSPGSPRYHPLLSDSPAIDAGNPAGCTDHQGNPLDTDQRGVARVGRCDIGAYEYTASGPAASITTIGGTWQTAPAFGAFGTPLEAAVLDSIGTPVSDTIVAFSAPVSGASGTFADSGTFTTTAATSESGVATAATFIANGLVGTYAVTATVSGVITPTNFLLTNLAWYVAPSGDDDNDCLFPMAACATINGVLGKPGFAAGDTILVATGTYTGTGNEVVLLDKSATLRGGWNETFTVQSGTSTVDGEGSRRGITVNIDVIASSVERFTIYNGFSDEGGGIHNVSFVARSPAYLSSSFSSEGGNIHNVSQTGVLTLTNCTVNSNTASTGGGILNHGNLTLNNSIISGNIGSSGLYNDGGTVTLNDSIVSGNMNGGIHNWNGSLTLNGSTVSRNTVIWSGGGIDTAYGSVTLNNSTVSGNTASGGGGIYNVGAFGNGIVTLNNSTVSRNTASGDGGGICNDDGGIVVLRNSILAGNAAGSDPDCEGTIGSAGYNLIGNTSGCDFSASTGDLLDVDAMLGPLEGSPDYHPLLPGSPAIDAGNPMGCTDHLGNPLLTDQRNALRLGRCDIGAYEFLNPDLTVTKQASPDPVQGGAPLTYTIRIVNTGNMHLHATITDTLPVSVTLGGTPGGTLIPPGGTVILPDGRVAVNWTAVITAPGGLWTGTVVVTVDEDQEGPLTNLVEVTSDEGATSKAIAIVNGHKVYLPLVMRNDSTR